MPRSAVRGGHEGERRPVQAVRARQGGQRQDVQHNRVLLVRSRVCVGKRTPRALTTMSVRARARTCARVREREHRPTKVQILGSVSP